MVRENSLLMAEELEVLWRKLSFTEEEDEGVELGSSSTKVAKVGKNYVIMKIMTPRSISLDTLRKNLRMLWKTNKGVNISELKADFFSGGVWRWKRQEENSRYVPLKVS